MRFKDFILKDSHNKWLIAIWVLAILIEFTVFKYYYPYAGFINGDSYVYLETAYHNLLVNTYPIGYSKFLRLISVFTLSDTVVVAIQYLLLQCSTMFFVFTLFYLYSPLKLTKRLLVLAAVLNPTYLYLANYISSDSLFLSLSLTWFTLLLWIMNKPTKRLIFLNALLLFVTFSVRYNALFYPIIGIVALLLTRKKIILNIAGFATSLFFILIFVQSTSTAYERVSGHRQFTPFSGWQLANNALYGYRYVDDRNLKKVPPYLQEIDKEVRNYFDSTKDVSRYPQERIQAGTTYMWAPNSPLTIYMNNQFKGDSTASALKKWATVAPIMKQYGTFIIRSYPDEFIKHFILPNAIKYYAPPVEFLDHYSTGVDSVNIIAQIWFDYKSNKLSTRFDDYKVNTLNYFPVLVGSMNVLLVLSILSFVLLRGYKEYPDLARGIVLVGFLWIVNFGFSVFASSIALRFQLFPILVSLSFTFLLMEYLIKASMGVSDKSRQSKDSMSVTTSIDSVTT